MGLDRADHGLDFVNQKRMRLPHPLFFLLFQSPDPAVLEFAGAFSRVLISGDCEAAIHALFAVVIEFSLTYLVDVYGEFLVLRYQDNLIRCIIILIERAGVLYA